MVKNKIIGFEDFFNVMQFFRIFISRSQCGERLCERIFV